MNLPDLNKWLTHSASKDLFRHLNDTEAVKVSNNTKGLKGQSDSSKNVLEAF